VTILDDIRPSPKLFDNLLNVCTEFSWERLGILDIERLPQQLYGPLLSSGLSLVNISAEHSFDRASDPNELSMWRRGVSIARRILETQLSQVPVGTDFALAGRLERAFRRVGIEDLLLLFSDGNSAPAPARGTELAGGFSVVVAAEYRGYWVRLARAQGVPSSVQQARERFEDVLRNLGRESVSPAQVCVRDISGSYPYECKVPAALTKGSVFSADVEVQIGGTRFFYGDTCRLEENGARPL
jgi:hypothetical protein